MLAEGLASGLEAVEGSNNYGFLAFVFVKLRTWIFLAQSSDVDKMSVAITSREFRAASIRAMWTVSCVMTLL